MKKHTILSVALATALGAALVLGLGGAHAQEPVDPVRAECFDKDGRPLNPPPPQTLDRADAEFPRKAQEFQDECVKAGGTAKFTLMREPAARNLIAGPPEKPGKMCGGPQLKCGEETTITAVLKDSIDAPAVIVRPPPCEYCEGLERLREIERLRSQGQGGTVLCFCTFQLERDPTCTLHNPCPQHAMGTGGFPVKGGGSLPNGWHPNGAGGWIPE